MVRLAHCLLFAASVSLLADPPRPVQEVVPDTFVPSPPDQEHLAGLLAARLRANTEGYLEHVKVAELASDPRAEGLFLQAAANSYEYTDDRNLKSVMDRVASNAASRKEVSAQSGYQLSGLLAYSTVTGDENTFAAARRLGDAMVSENVLNVGWISPLLELFRQTRDTRYEDFARNVVQKTSDDASSFERLVRARGLVDLYRWSGDDSLLQQAESVWKTESKNSFDGVDGSTCDAVSWMDLNLELAKVTGTAVYAEQLESVLYNRLLAGQNPRTGAITANPGSEWCSNFEAAGLSEIPDATWGRYGSGVGLLTYSPGRAIIRLRRRVTVQLYVESSYPETGNVLVHVEPTHDAHFSIRLRVPSWTKSFTAEISGNKTTGKPGEFLVLSREWRRGDTVRITMDMSLTQAGRFLRRGPQILVPELSLNPDIEDLQALQLPTAAEAKLTAAPVENRIPGFVGAQTYQVDATYKGNAQPVTLAPLSDSPKFLAAFSANK